MQPPVPFPLDGRWTRVEFSMRCCEFNAAKPSLLLAEAAAVPGFVPAQVS